MNIFILDKYCNIWYNILYIIRDYITSINFCQVEILVLTNNQIYDIIALSSRRW